MLFTRIKYKLKTTVRKLSMMVLWQPSPRRKQLQCQKSLVKKKKKGSCIWDDCILDPCSKQGNEFYTSWLCFLIIITPQVEPCFLYQRQLGERVSTASCQARWWMVLLNLLQRCCIIVCHCSKSSYLLGQGCHRHHTASTPDFSPPLCGLSTSSLFHPSPSFPSPRWLRYHGGFVLFFVFF